ncbi:hypothetical protein Tco_0324046 [Tanacetum coccineum]
MIRVLVTIKILVITNLHSILRVSHNSSTVVSSVEQQQFDYCEVCGGPHYSSDCQTRNQLFFQPSPGNNYDFPCFDQPPQYHIDPSPPQDLDSESHFMRSHRDTNRILEELLRNLKPNSPTGEPRGSDNYTEVTYDKDQCLSDHYTAPVTPPAYTPSIPFLATMEPLDTFLMGDEVISTILERKNDKFIKSSVDDLVPIPKDSEVTSDSDLECDMPATTALPTTDVREEILDINLPLGKHLDTLSTGDKEIDFDPFRDIEELERLLADDPVPVPRVGNSDSISRSFDVTYSNLLFDFDDNFTLRIDNKIFDDNFEDLCSLDLLKATPLLDESILLVTPLPDPEHIFLREVKRFDPFFSLTQSGGKTRVMETLLLVFIICHHPVLLHTHLRRTPYDLEDLRACFQSSNHAVSDHFHDYILGILNPDHIDESYFHEAWDHYKDLLHACPHHGFTELHQLDTFYNALNPTDQDFLNYAAGGNLLERSTRDVLTIIENKSKVRNSRNKSIVSQVKSSDVSSSSPYEIAKLTHAVNQKTSDVTIAMTAILKQFQPTPPPASVKAVEEICVTCGGAHPYYQCLTTDGNTFLEYLDNIQGYVSAAAVNYNQGNSGYRPLGVANQTRLPGLAQPNVQNNQNRFSQPQGYNRGNNFNQNPTCQAPTQQNQNVPLSELEKIKKMNDVNIKSMQAQINNVKNELKNEMQTLIQASMSNQTNELKNMMASFFQMNTASSLGLGSLPCNTIANPKGKLKAITT